MLRFDWKSKDILVTQAELFENIGHLPEVDALLVAAVNRNVSLVVRQSQLAENILEGELLVVRHVEG